MNFKLISIFILLIGIVGTKSLSRDVKIIAAKNSMINNLIQLTFPSNDVIGPSLEMALENCKELFKWDRWNCPSSDFLSKRNSKNLDREAAFVKALTTASLIYTITKNCSNGKLPECGCDDHSSRENDYNDDTQQKCSENTDYAEQLVEEMFKNKMESSTDAQGYAVLHNDRVGRMIVRNSLHKICRCYDFLNPCTEETCLTVLKPFNEIATEIRKMYDKAILLRIDNNGIINADNIPNTVLIYVHESPNYCQANAIPGWKGMIGRQCSRDKNKVKSVQQRRSCKNLCRTCGLRIRTETVFGQYRCNCRFKWCCEVKCDVCRNIETQYFCY